MHRASARATRALLAEKGQRAWVELTRLYGKTFQNGGMVVTCEPEAVRALLMERAHTADRPPVHKMMARLPGADGILFMDGERWLTRARALMPVFHHRNVDSCAALLHDTTTRHLVQWRKQERVDDLYDAIQQLGAEAVLRIGYGLDPQRAPTVQLARALIEYKQYTMSPDPRYRLDEFRPGASKLFGLPRIASLLFQMRKHAAAVRNAVRAVVVDGQARADRPDWIRQLVGADITGDLLADEVNHLYGAYNAVDYVTTAALYELARDQRLTDAIRSELSTALGDREPPVREDLPALPRTHAYMLEILRRYPVTMGAVRVTGAPLHINGDVIPKGRQVMILLHALHHHPDFWEDADQLKPERWIASRSPKVPFSYVPFLEGPRKCIGRAMAEMQLLVVISAIVRRTDLRVFGEAIVPPFMIPRFAAPIPFATRAAAHPSSIRHPAGE